MRAEHLRIPLAPTKLPSQKKGSAEHVCPILNASVLKTTPAARKKCIEVHGTACNICGFDFGTVYGLEFVGKIHVHHKLPLHEIKEDYVVDPVEDLIPVCPNCHMILHSKPGGFYTVDEVKTMVKK